MRGPGAVQVFHSDTHRLVEYWRSLKAGPGAPPRSRFDPCGRPDLLPRMFVTGYAEGEAPLRLVGETLRELWRSDLRGLDLRDLFREYDRAKLDLALGAAAKAAEALVLRAEGGGVEVEILVAPLAGSDGRTERLFGCLQVLGGAPISGERSVGTLALRSAASASSPAPAKPRLAAVDGRLLA